MQPTVWLKPGILMIYGASLDTTTHKHQAIQIVWSASSAVCKFDEKEISGSLIINSQIEHQLQMEAGWVLLVEPKSDLGQQLSDRLGQCDAMPIEQITPFSNEQPRSSDDPRVLLSPIFNKLGLELDFAGTATEISDKRIQQLLASLNNCLPEGCLKPTSWRAAEVAESLFLSESRFLHLFSEQMGVAWRPFLLWHRMICAINAIIKGSSVTDAAHMAGFSDSAHLSRTFRSLFGMSIRESQSLFPK
ncbi:MAG: AraC-like DNA-binding protein [Glaciecola sp.]|jgi:AraC-like DNA-binding protein